MGYGSDRSRALSRVGAITDRTREILKERGIELNEDTSVLEKLEELDTGITSLQPRRTENRHDQDPLHRAI